MTSLCNRNGASFAFLLLFTVAAIGLCGCVYEDKCYELLDSGQYDSAIAACTTAIESGRGNPDFDLGNRGIAYMRTIRFDKAKADLEKAIELNPANSNNYYNMACLYSLANDRENACFWLRKAVDRGMADREFIKKDPDLDNMRTAPCYKQILAGSQTTL